MSATAGSVNGMREITLAGWSPYGMAAGPDGPVWMTVLSPPGLARLSLDGPEVTLRELPAKPLLVAVGADGTVWHTSQDDRIGRDGESWFALPTGAAPYGIAADQGGGAFFSAPGIDRIGHITASGEITMVEAPGYAAMVTVGADGAAWVALNAAGKLARWDGRGDVELVDVTPAAPVGVAAAGERVWFADIAGGGVGLADRGGVVDRVTLGDPGCRPHAVVASPEGGCWVTLWGSGQLARVEVGGSVTLFDLPGEEPHGVALAGGEVWVAMESGSVVRVPAGASARR
jgi:virginiamycin B lyase